MIRKITSALALFVALVGLMASPGMKANAQGHFYVAQYHGASWNDPCYTFGNNWDPSTNGTILHYDCLTGNSYSGTITKVDATGPNSGVIYSVGYMNGSTLAIGRDEISADGTNVPHVYDFFANNGSYATLANSQEMFDVNHVLAGPSLWGYVYFW